MNIIEKSINSFLRLINGNVYLLSGLIKCGHCGSHLVNAHTVGRVKDKFFYYECSRSRQQLGCSFKRLSAPMFDNEIIKYFKRASENQEVIVKAIGNAILESQVKFDKIANMNTGLKTKKTFRTLRRYLHTSVKIKHRNWSTRRKARSGSMMMPLPGISSNRSAEILF